MRALVAIALLVALSACKGGGVSEDTKKAVENVVTLRSGTVSELHEQYGTYMRHEGEQSTRAARRAAGTGGV